MVLSASPIAGSNHYPIPGDMTPAQGSRGHLKRLVWTQWKLSRLYHQLQAKLLFSPVPEAPLHTPCRSIVMAHDLIALRFPKAFSPLTVYARYYVPQVLHQAEHIICNSMATAKDIANFYNISPRKITPIPLACDTQTFRFLNLPRQNYFLYLGRLDPYKNVQQLLAAFAAMPHNKDYELWIAGPEDQRFQPTLQMQAQALGIATQTRFLNYVPYEQLPIVINQAIALVFPSLWEGFGLPVLEAMACGTPVIASNLASIPEVTGDAALLINPYEVTEITHAMATLANDAQTQAQLSAAGRDRASQFSWQKTGAATADILRQFL